MTEAPVYITDIIGSVVAATNTALRADASSWLATKNRNINYVYGGKNHVWKALNDIKLDPLAPQNGVTAYPFFGLNLPIGTGRGARLGVGYYGVDKIPSIFIATLSDNTSLPPAKYTNNIKPVLFPIYYEFLTQLAKTPGIIIQGGANAVEHEMWEYPADIAGVTVLNAKDVAFPDYVDVLVIQNLSFLINQQLVKVC